jgi:hypothetical protein
MQYLGLLWDSSQALSTVGTVLKFVTAISGFLVLVLGLRESALRKQADAAKNELITQRISAAEAATKPRRLTSEQRESLTDALANFTEKPKIFICAGILDSESVTFGEDIESVFISAGFEVYFPKKPQADASLTVGPPGLHLVVKDTAIANPFAAKLQRSFMAAGVEIPGIHSGDATFPDDRIEIAVGQR